MMHNDQLPSTPLEAQTDRKGRGLLATAIACAGASIGLEIAQLMPLGNDLRGPIELVSIVALISAIVTTASWARHSARNQRLALRCFDESSRAAADGVLAS